MARIEKMGRLYRKVNNCKRNESFPIIEIATLERLLKIATEAKKAVDSDSMETLKVVVEEQEAMGFWQGIQ